MLYFRNLFTERPYVMDYIDFLWIKFIAFVVIAGIIGFIKGLNGQ